MNRTVAHRLQRLLIRYDQRLAELQEQRRHARRERVEAWERLCAIRSQQAELDLAIAPHSRAPAFSWQLERREERREERKRARAERAREEAARAPEQETPAVLSDLEVWSKL